MVVVVGIGGVHVVVDMVVVDGIVDGGVVVDIVVHVLNLRWSALCYAR